MTLPPLAAPDPRALTTERWDLIIVGGGVVGLSLTLAAARRGWRVLCLEAGDLGSGASSASTRLWHGGIRYLDHDGAEALVAEGLQARHRWMAAFPWAGTWRQTHALVESAEAMARWTHRVQRYAALDPGAGHPPEWLTREQVMTQLTGLRGWQGVGAWTSLELTFAEPRVLVMLARQAVAAGAVMALDTPVIHAAPEDAGWQLAITSPAGGAHRLTAARLALATGAITPQWALDLAVPPTAPQWGSHLLLDRTVWPLGRAILWHHPEDGRLLYAFPTEGSHVLVGTTATTTHAPQQDAAYLFRGIQQVAQREGVTDRALVRLWSGPRGLLQASEDPAARDMRVAPMGATGVAAQGAKWTTAPLLAAMALRTLDPAWAWEEAVWAAPDRTPLPPRPDDIGPALWSRWLARFGPEAAAVAALARTTLGGLRALGDSGATVAEVLYVQQMEAASTPERVAARLDLGHDRALLQALRPQSPSGLTTLPT